MKIALLALILAALAGCAVYPAPPPRYYPAYAYPRPYYYYGGPVYYRPYYRY